MENRDFIGTDSRFRQPGRVRPPGGPPLKSRAARPPLCCCTLAVGARKFMGTDSPCHRGQTPRKRDDPNRNLWKFIERIFRKYYFEIQSSRFTSLRQTCGQLVRPRRRAPRGLPGGLAFLPLSCPMEPNQPCRRRRGGSRGCRPGRRARASTGRRTRSTWPSSPSSRRG